MKKMTQIPVNAYSAAGFIKKYQTLVSDTVIPYQYSVLWDKAPDTEKSHAVKNFINAAKALKGEDTDDGFYGMVFQDSDVAKWIEAAAFSLANRPDEELEKKVDEIIDIVAAAQDKDGYLNTRFTITDREKRWTNLLEGHELYCAGHMTEAACAYYEATGKRKLLEVMQKNIAHIYERFVKQDTEGIPGHPEIELALMKLYRLTKDEKALELCKHFIDKRGQDPTFFSREVERRDWTVWGANPVDNEYMQNGAPVREQSDAVGHAVRAVYLYTGMADLASETGDEELLSACRRLWKSIVEKRMYVTGGIGSTAQGEAFTVDYDLPSDTAYAETCASIGLMFFASRMLENEIKGEYADIMELAFYNTVLAGMQLDGKRFFYVNPLRVTPGISGKAITHRHVVPVRPKWYACACCPPNAARLIGSFGKYAYGENRDSVFCHLYAAGEVSFSNGMKLNCETEYPYEMSVRYRVSGNGRLAVRIPAWSRNTSVTVNGVQTGQIPVDGYLYVDIDSEADVELHLDGTPAFIRASARVPGLSGMCAIKRGPLVYCFEEADNGRLGELRIDKKQGIRIGEINEELGAVTLSLGGERISDITGLYSSEPEVSTPCRLTAVPYYTWGNRGENEMSVWMAGN